MTRRTVLAFDLGGVLIENAGRERLTALLPPGTPAGDVPLRWLACPIVQAFERGQVGAQEFAATLVEEWKLPLRPDEFIDAFRSWPVGFYPGVQELLDGLRARHRVVCLSNSNELHWGRFPEVATLFDRAWSSHQIGHVKPDREAFAHVLAEAEDPSDIHFFDDLEPNVATARELGIHAYRVEGIEGVRAALRRAGLDG